MMIQYCYAVLTMLPCPIWFFSRWASASFLVVVFAWSVYNGATYYIDVFGKRFQKELEALKAEVVKWQNGADLAVNSPLITPNPDGPVPITVQVSAPATASGGNEVVTGSAAEKYAVVTKVTIESHSRSTSIDRIPLLTEEDIAEATASGVDKGAKDVAIERKVVESTA
jgi:hypothetical protein